MGKISQVEIDELHKTMAWRSIEAEITRLIDYHTKALVTKNFPDMAEVAYSQAYVRALNGILLLGNGK